jgi:Glycosyl hydrolase family 14
VKSRHAWIGAAAVAIALALGAPAAGAAVADGFYGVNVQNVFDDSSSRWGPQLSAMAAGGITLARVDARWANVEPRAPSGGHHSYNWSYYDSIAQAMAQHGIRWYPIIDYSTPWAGVTPGDSNSAVALSHVADFATYANVFAQRYGRGGSFWRSHPGLPQLPVTSYEIWNEENSTTFLHPQTNAPEQYADLYMAARAAIKPVDAQAEVVVGGLALGTQGGGADEISFLQRMFAHRPDMRGNVDAVALHPYQLAVSDVYARIAGFRTVLDQLAGPQVPLEITEVGWSTSAVSDSQRGANLADLTQTLPRTDCNIPRLITYSWTSPEQSRSNADDWFGIYNHNATPKPSGVAFLGSVRTMRGMSSAAAPSGTVTICHRQAPAAAPPVGPALKLRLGLGRGRSSLRVVARCPSGCRLRLVLLAPRPGAPVRLAHRTARFSRRRRVFRFRITHRVKRHHRVVLLQVVAVGASGAQTTSSRSVRIR